MTVDLVFSVEALVFHAMGLPWGRLSAQGHGVRVSLTSEPVISENSRQKPPMSL